jgi:hypothetical protein
VTESTLQEAQRIVHGDRAASYGAPIDNHSTTAAMVDAYLLRKHGHTRGPLDAEDIAVFNILQKVSREAHAPRRDNAVDIAGYAENLQMIRDEREARAVCTGHSIYVPWPWKRSAEEQRKAAVLADVQKELEGYP